MKQITKLIPLALLVCLAGCSITYEPPDDTSVPPTSTAGYQESADATTAISSEPSVTDPPATDPPATEPPATEPPAIVQPEPDDEDFVRVKDYIPDIVVDLRFSTDNNFTGQRIYDFTDVWLRYGTVKKLILVQEELKQNDMCLKIWDGFRPTAAQFKLWEVCPMPVFVANPTTGFSAHSRGNTVDISLCRIDGTDVEMPTDFDEFSDLADRDYSDCTPEAAENALLLEQTMEKYGFRPYSAEWWHFTDTQGYEVEKVFAPTYVTWYYADCNEYISLRVKPSTSAEVITTIPVNEQFQVLAFADDFAFVAYQGLYGYVLRDYISAVSE